MRGPLETTTRQVSAVESRAVNRIGPPSDPRSSGEYSFGRPIEPTRAAITPSRPYSRLPGQVVGPVSRWPEIARRKTGRPDGYSGLPSDTQVSVERGSTWAMSRRQARSRSRALSAADVID